MQRKPVDVGPQISTFLSCVIVTITQFYLHFQILSTAYKSLCRNNPDSVLPQKFSSKFMIHDLMHMEFCTLSLDSPWLNRFFRINRDSFSISTHISLCISDFYEFSASLPCSFDVCVDVAATLCFDFRAQMKNDVIAKMATITIPTRTLVIASL